MPERMSQQFAVFNNHVNKAGERADAEFKEQFGLAMFDKHIAPLRESGIMAVLHMPKNIEEALARAAWVALCTAYVNEGRTPPRVVPA